MKIESLGHASLVVRCDDANLVFDPLLFGVHHEGLYDVYPEREIDLEAFPEVGALFVSHAHADHFDPDSLAAFDRDTPVVAAADPLLIGALEGLGFSQITIARNLQTIDVGGVRVTPTPAAQGAPEHGFLIEDAGTTIWHMVDTFPGPDLIAAVLERVEQIDVLIAPWQPLQDATFSAGTPVHFPFAMYGLALSAIAQISPKILVPGACGFRAIGPAAYTNHLMFPVTRERFLHDVRGAVPELAEGVLFLDPGDALIVRPGVTATEEQMVRYCHRVADSYKWEELAFRPFEMGFPVVEHRGEAFVPEQCGETLEAFFTEALPEFISEHPQGFAWHHRWQVIRNYEVVYHGGRTATWSIDFRRDPPVVNAGLSPLALSHTLLPAGLLVGLIAGTVSWDYARLSAELRQYDHCYLSHPTGLQRPESIQLKDPLAMMLAGRDATERFVSLQIERVAGESSARIGSEGEASSPSFDIDSDAVIHDVLSRLGEGLSSRTTSEQE